MAPSLKHLFTSAKAASSDGTKVDGPKWNDEHVLTLATQRLLGRMTAGAGAVEEIPLGPGLSFSGGALDVVAAGGGMTLLGTIDLSTGGSVRSLSGLDLTDYDFLIVAMANASLAAGANISFNTTQIAGLAHPAAYNVSALVFNHLPSTRVWALGNQSVSPGDRVYMGVGYGNAATVVTLSVTGGTTTFDNGMAYFYGVK